MRISQCTRCDQLIEYDASYEGEEVLCPACDNITRLSEIPPDELPELESESDEKSGDDKSSRAPLRISADDIPKPDHDPVAPLNANTDDDLRGPDKIKNEPAPIDRDAPISERSNAGVEEKKSKQLNAGKAVDLPEGAEPEIKILDGANSVAFFGGDSSDDDGTITIPGKVAIPIVVLLALAVLAVKFWPEKDHQAEGRRVTKELRAQIEARMAEMRRSVQAEMAQMEQPEEVMSAPVSSSGPPPRSLAELLREREQATRAFVGTNVYTFAFPKVPEKIIRSVQRYDDEAFKTYVQTALKLPYRRFDDTVTDLRTLAFAMRRGMTEFDDQWKLVGGLVAGKNDEGLLLRLDRRYFGENKLVQIDEFPESEGISKNTPLGVLGRTAGERAMKVDDNEKQAIEVYKFGQLPSAATILVLQEKALEREKVARSQIKTAERRKTEKAKEDDGIKRRANNRNAVAYLRKRIKEGSASAEYSLGLRYLSGEGVPKDRNEGLRLIRKAAKAGVYLAKKKLKELGE